MKILVLVMALAAAQTKPTPAEINEWQNNKVLESSPCKQITWLLESESKGEPNMTKQPIHYALGWWARGFVEGAIYILGNKEAEKKVDEFGLSVDVAAA